MRLLACCSGCKRQYDASNMKPGERFRCSCGTLITIATPTSMVLAVAHCGTCGAARTNQSTVCAFCKSMFSDADLRRNTMCPSCFGQIADSAAFCDHCGIAIQPTRMADCVTTLACPSCSPATLRTRHLPETDHAIDECARCGGAWLEAALFDRLVDRARERVLTIGKATIAKTLASQNGPLYRPCPVCKEMMNRKNYGGNSAVIIDICKNHGLWFDADELNRVITWIRNGGLDRQRERERSAAQVQQRIIDQRSATTPTTWDTPETSQDTSVLIDIGVDLLASVIGSIFRKR